ncbi:hypothetical protein AB0J83_29185 [Actinoplanes sp. NPDC049596]|uniref:hypothetical protein n=1 Tax=unclassified Actinoplanes TaxID=2626549 RepID=UPI00341236BC
MTNKVRTSDRGRFEELFESGYGDQVVAANRLYLSAAVPDALATERDHWALSCLPATNGYSRFSTLSMAGQETFAVFRPRGGGVPTAHVFVSKQSLKASGVNLQRLGLIIYPSPYKKGGEDQVQVFGSSEDVVRALAEAPLRRAARDFAGQLLDRASGFSRFHSPALADRVLGRSWA